MHKFERALAGARCGVCGYKREGTLMVIFPSGTVVCWMCADDGWEMRAMLASVDILGLDKDEGHKMEEALLAFVGLPPINSGAWHRIDSGHLSGLITLDEASRLLTAQLTPNQTRSYACEVTIRCA